jgi:cell division transport system permease protein
MYLLKLALRPWRIAPLSQVFSALAVGFMLMLAGFLFWIDRGMVPVVARLQGEQVITAFLDPSLEVKEQERVIDSIRMTVGAHPAEIDVVEPDQFVGTLREDYPELSKELENLGSEMTALIPKYVSVAGVLPDSTLHEMKQISGIEQVESSKDRYHSVLGAFFALRWIAKLLVVGICMALLTGLIHLSRMNSYLQRDAVSLLRLWGAGHFTLRAPGILSGLWVGLSGGLIALAGWVLSSQWLSNTLHSLSPLLADLPQPGLNMGLALVAAGSLLGMLTGALTSESRG